MACLSKTPKKKHLKSSKYRLRNWPEYNNALKTRGSILMWVDPNCDWIFSGKRKPGGKIIYSDLAIEMYLQVCKVYHLALRQGEGFMGDIMKLLRLDLPIPDYTVISKRAKKLDIKLKRFSQEAANSRNKTTYMIIDSTGLKIYGEGEWANVKHGTKYRRDWRKLHISVNKDGDIQAVTLTDRHTSDASQVPILQDQVCEKVDVAITDGAYDDKAIYASFLERNPSTRIIIPPRKTAILSEDSILEQRNKHIHYVRKYGRDSWEENSGYSQQARAENTMFRYKTILGGKLSARIFESQQNEVVLGCSILNKMASFGMPKSYKVA